MYAFPPIISVNTLTDCDKSYGLVTIFSHGCDAFIAKPSIASKFFW